MIFLVPHIEWQISHFLPWIVSMLYDNRCFLIDSLAFCSIFGGLMDTVGWISTAYLWQNQSIIGCHSFCCLSNISGGSCIKTKMNKYHKMIIRYLLFHDQTRGKKILWQLSRTPFLTWFENPALFSLLRSCREKAGTSNRVLESCSNILFPLMA